MPTQKIKLGTKGFNADIPPYALPPDYFNDGQNMRFKDGSMQACVALQPFTGYSLQTSGISIQPIRNAQYTPFGTTYLNSVVVGLNPSNNLTTRYVEYGTTVEVPLATGPQTYSNQYGIDNFIFNGISIVNTKTAQPMYFNANDTAFGSIYKVLPSWIMTTAILTPFTSVTVSGGVANFGSSITAYITLGCFVGGADSYGNPNAIYRVSNIAGNTVTLEGNPPNGVFSAVYVAYPYFARGMTSFENRLIAYNLYAVLPSGISGDNFSPIELAWSNPITDIASLANVDWNVSATNSAGYDYVTQTPGEILAANVLGEYLMVYKNDSVYKFYDAGAPNYIIGQQIYNYDGAMNFRSVVSLGDTKHFVVGNRSIYLTQGGIDAQNISRGFVEEYFFKGPTGIDTNYTGLNFCYHNIQEKEVWICYRSKTATAPTTGGLAGCDRALCYQYITNSWYPRTLNNILDIADYQVGGSLYPVVCQPTTTSTFPTILSYFPYPAEFITGIFESECSAYWDQRDLGTAQVVKTTNAIYPHALEPLYVQMYFKNRIDPRDSTQPLRYFDPSLTYKLDYRITGRYMYLAIIGDATGTSGSSSNPYVCDIDLDTEPRGRR